MNIFFSLFFVAAATTSVAFCVLFPLAKHLKLLDHPRGHKTHTLPIPLIGGIATFAGTMVAIYFMVPLSQEVRFFMLSSATLVFVGVLDDKYDLSVRIRFVSHVLAASILVFGGELYFHNLGALTGGTNIQLGPWGTLFTYLAVMAAINAYNMIDGIDGLLGSQVLIAAAAIAIIAYNTPAHSTYLVSVILCASLVPFLWVNLQNSKPQYRAFMGDAGSMFLGLAIVWLLLVTTQETPNNQLIDKVMNPVTALWLIGLPLMDMTYVIWRRLIQGANPVRPDQRHVHHLLRLIGLNRTQVVAFMAAVTATMAVIGVASEWLNAPEHIMFMAYLMVYVGYTRFIIALKKRAGRDVYTSR